MSSAAGAIHTNTEKAAKGILHPLNCNNLLRDTEAKVRKIQKQAAKQLKHAQQNEYAGTLSDLRSLIL